MLFLKFKSEIKNLINKGEKIIISFSGGSDSVFLLEMLLKLKKEYFLTIELAYLNDSLRIDSCEEQKFVENIALKKNIFLHKKILNIFCIARESKKSIETIGREERYKFFEEISKENDKVALAHHLDDNIETFLFRLIRGTSLSGFKSIPFKRGKFIRPLVKNFYKKEILKYLNENNIEYFDDYSNKKNIYSRNKIRNTLIPLLKEYNPRIKENIKNIIEEVNSIPETISKNFFNFKEKLDIKILNKLQLNDQKKIIANFLKKYIEPTKEKIENILKILNKNGTISLDVGENKILIKRYDTIIIKNKEMKVFNEIFLTLDEEVIFNNYVIKAEITNNFENVDLNETKKGTFYVNLDKIRLDSLKVRTRLPGDYFWECGTLFNKKLKKYFIDSKIPRDIRDFIPLIVNNRKIIFLIGFKGSEEFKVDLNSKGPMLKISFENFKPIL